MKKTIDLNKFREIVDALLSSALETHGQFVDIDKSEDYYLNFSLQDWYQVLSPGDPDIGQISEDWEFLEKMRETDYGVTLMLVHAAAIMRFLAAKGSTPAVI